MKQLPDKLPKRHYSLFRKMGSKLYIVIRDEFGNESLYELPQWLHALIRETLQEAEEAGSDKVTMDIKKLLNIR